LANTDNISIILPANTGDLTLHFIIEYYISKTLYTCVLFCSWKEI